MSDRGWIVTTLSVCCVVFVIFLGVWFVPWGSVGASLHGSPSPVPRPSPITRSVNATVQVRFEVMRNGARFQPLPIRTSISIRPAVLVAEDVRRAVEKLNDAADTVISRSNPQYGLATIKSAQDAKSELSKIDTSKPASFAAIREIALKIDGSGLARTGLEDEVWYQAKGDYVSDGKWIDILSGEKIVYVSVKDEPIVGEWCFNLTIEPEDKDYVLVATPNNAIHYSADGGATVHGSTQP